MYFSRVEMKFDPVRYRQIISLEDNLYSSHQLLWKLFPEDREAKRDFLFRQELKGHIPYYYILSERKPENLRNLFDIETKNYDPVIRKDGSFIFKLRMNPVITRKSPGKKNSVKHDIRMNYKKEGISRGLKGDLLKGFIDNQVKEWLTGKSGGYGFTPEAESLVISRYTLHKFRKSREGRAVQFSSLDFEGILTVTEPGLFRDVLFSGLGRARAFGCGLLMIRRR